VSGFAADWLSLRAPADTAARNRALLAKLSAWAAGRERLSVLDLGCGTGATLRAVAPTLPCRQHWLLVDYDAALLRHCPERLGQAEVATAQFDLARELEMLPWESVDLVTASALLDLVSTDWIGRLAGLARNAAIYCALSVDGRIALDPPVPEDARVLRLIAAHHRRRKSFGPALGYKAPVAAADLLRAAGRTVELAPADWELGPDMAPLQSALLDGYAEAATEQAPEAGKAIDTWRKARAALPAQTIRVGHQDLLSLPADR
jgi:SAM-dependent methyltransferase